VPQGIAGIVAGTGTLESVVVAGNIQVKANEGGGVRQQQEQVEQVEQVEQAEQVEVERQVE